MLVATIIAIEDLVASFACSDCFVIVKIDSCFDFVVICFKIAITKIIAISH